MTLHIRFAGLFFVFLFRLLFWEKAQFLLRFFVFAVPPKSAYKAVPALSVGVPYKRGMSGFSKSLAPNHTLQAALPAKGVFIMKHKKLVSVLAVAVLSATFVFAIDLSAGGGFDFSYLSQSVKTSGSPFPGVEINGKYSMSMMQMGVNGFFDAQYVTAKLGIAFNVGNPKISYSITQKALGIENWTLPYWENIPLRSVLQKFIPFWVLISESTSAQNTTEKI